jgi:hypothetical protein
MKTTKTTRIRASLIPNPNHETRKNKNKNTTCANKNPTRFYYEEEIEQGYDQKLYPKLTLNRQKVMRNSTFIYTHWAPSSKKLKKKLSIYMWPMVTHVHPCASCVKYE